MTTDFKKSVTAKNSSAVNLKGNPRVAIIHDWLITYRGGERMLEAIGELFPNATIFTLFHDPKTLKEVLSHHEIKASFLNKIPKVKKFYRALLPLMPMAIEQFDLGNFDLVISSSHCVAKGVIVSPTALHICYCYTPMRYAWDKTSDYFTGWKKAFTLPFLHYLRQWDVTSSARVDCFIAISNFVKQRIKKYYRRESIVINPFANLEGLQSQDFFSGDYYLTVSALAPYKRVDLAIAACEKLKRRLLVVGDGQDRNRLKQIAGKYTEFLGLVEAEKLKSLYQGARAFLFPGEEDFGIAPLESMACGRPVIAFGRGGTLETVIDGKTGLFFKEPTVDSLINAIEDFERREKEFSKELCIERAVEFSKEKFLLEFTKQVEILWLKNLKTKAAYPIDVQDSKATLSKHDQQSSLLSTLDSP